MTSRDKHRTISHIVTFSRPEDGAKTGPSNSTERKSPRSLGGEREGRGNRGEGTARICCRCACCLVVSGYLLCCVVLPSAKGCLRAEEDISVSLVDLRLEIRCEDAYDQCKDTVVSVGHDRTGEVHEQARLVQRISSFGQKNTGREKRRAIIYFV
jgi:hypothetical protein